MTDGFPQFNPKTTATASFTMTPVNQVGTMYNGARDDYTFDFTYSTSSTTDISLAKLIAIVLPSSGNADFVILGKDCV